MQVGMTELRTNFLRLFELVREGEEILVTNRGKPVVRILPPEGQRKIDMLIAAGIVVPPPPHKSTQR